LPRRGLAPEVGFEPTAKRLIPTLSGLYSLSYKCLKSLLAFEPFKLSFSAYSF
jgi:hypothetical protein